MAEQRPRHYTLRDAATKIVDVLQAKGYTAYFAGGCVRDRLLGYAPKDYDIATDARPETVCELFNNTQYVGEAFGVVIVRLMGHTVEVATFRLEWGYEDGRRPTSIDFTDAQHDAQRRDFTINGLFENPLSADEDEQIIDYVGGQADLAKEIVRAIGEPEERFNEDYLRMLRAVRFAARLDFKIDSDTAAAITRQAENLAKISRERIGQEMRWMLTNRGGARAVELIQNLALDAPALDEPHREAPIPTVERLEQPLTEMAAQFADDQLAGAYAMILTGWLFDRHIRPNLLPGPNSAVTALDLAEAIENHAAAHLKKTLRRLRNALCLTNEEQKYLETLFRLWPHALRWEQLGIAHRKRLLAEKLWPETIALLNGLGYETTAVVHQQIIEQSRPLIREGVAPPPLLTGDDLIAAGYKPGPHFKAILDAVYDAQLEMKISDRQQALRLAESLQK